MYAMYGRLESIFGLRVLCIYLEFYRIGLLYLCSILITGLRAVIYS